MSNKISLSNRLSKIASFVEEGDIVADIGADHGYLSMFLAQKYNHKGYATEYGKGPFYKVIDKVEENNLQNLVECYQADGLEGLREDVNTLIIAGMGGRTIKDILCRKPKDLVNINKIIVEPQSEAFLVRDSLMERGFKIVHEEYLLERGKAYPLIVAIKGAEENSYEDYELEFGRISLKNKDKILFDYLNRTKNLLSKVEENGQLNPKSKVELELCRKVLKQY